MTFSEHRNFRARTRRRSGFSLIELTVVLSILVILANIGFPKYATAVARYRVSAGASRIVCDLDLARGQARASSTPVTVLFNTANNSYQVVGMTDLSNRSSTYTVSLAAPQYRVTLAASGFTGATSITFDQYGMPAAGGVLVVAVGDYKKTLTIDASTGKVTVQ